MCQYVSASVDRRAGAPEWQRAGGLQHLVLLSCVASVGLGCGERAPEVPAVAVRDSAGITIVENVGPAWREGEGWRLSQQPSVRIGQVEGDNEYLLLGPLSALRLDDSTIVVSNTGTEEIRFYDAEGRYLRTAGGRGGGPGEFSNLVWIYPLGADTIVAWDDNPPRIAFFYRDGSFASSVRPEQYGGVLKGVFPDGSLLQAEHVDWSNRPSDGRMRQPAWSYRLDRDGAILDSLPVFPAREFEMRRSGRSVGISPPPFGRSTPMEVSGDGFYAGTQDVFEVGYYDLRGNLKTLLRWPGTDQLVTDEHIAAYRSSYLGRTRSENARRSAEEWLESATFPEQLPAYGDLVDDDEGNLWIEEYHPRWETFRRWTVFDSDLRMLGTVDMPGNFVVHQIGSDFVLGYTWDEYDVEYVELYQIIKQ